MAVPPPSLDPLRAHFSGKRRYTRTAVIRPVSLKGVGVVHAGRLLDLSAGGALVEVVDPAFYEAQGDGLAGLALVERAFPEGLGLRFDAEDVLVQAEVVRVTPLPGEHLGLGCRFVRPLENFESVLLGVTPEGEIFGSSHRPARGSTPLTLLLYDPHERIAGPRAAARIDALAGSSLRVEAPGDRAALRRLASELSGKVLQGVVLYGRRRLWSGAIRLVACRPAVNGGPGTLYLRATQALGPEFERCFAAGRG